MKAVTHPSHLASFNQQHVWELLPHLVPVPLAQAYGIQQPRVTNNLIMAIALVPLVLLTCTMTYMQEKSANDVMNSLKKMMPNKASDLWSIR